MHFFRRTRSFARLGALCLLAMSATCRADDVTDGAVKAFHAQMPTATVTVKDFSELEVKNSAGESKTVFLDNLRKTCRADPPRCELATTDFVKNIAPLMATGSKPAAFMPEKVYPILRRRGFAAQVAHLSDKPGTALVQRDFVSDVELLFVIDGEHTLQYVTQEEFAKAGLASDAGMALATVNASRLPPVEPQPVPRLDGLFVLMYGDSLGTARLFDAALWDRLEARAGGPVAAVAVTRDWIVYTRLDDAAHVAALRTVARRVVAKEAYGVSEIVVKRQGSGWVPVPEN